MTKYLSVSIAFPGPTAVVHQPSPFGNWINICTQIGLRLRHEYASIALAFTFI